MRTIQAFQLKLAQCSRMIPNAMSVLSGGMVSCKKFTIESEPSLMVHQILP